MSIEINTKNYQKPQENKKPIKKNEYHVPHKKEPSNGTYILSFIIVMILWLIMKGY